MKNSNIVKKYILQILAVIKDLLFVIGNERSPIPGPIIIAYRNYLPESINRYLIIKMLMRQGFLRPIAEDIADFYLSHKSYRGTLKFITRDPILRFLTKVNTLCFGKTPSAIKEEIKGMSDPNQPRRQIVGTIEEQIAQLRSLLEEMRQKKEGE